MPTDRTITIALLLLAIAVAVAGMAAYFRRRGDPSAQARERAHRTLASAVILAMILSLLAVFLPRLID